MHHPTNRSSQLTHRSTSHLHEDRARQQAQMVLVQTIKEDIIDAVNDLKSKDDVWALTEKQKA